MAGPPALRRVAGNVQKITFFLALRAYSRWRYGRNKKTTLAAFPVGLTAFRADIPCELTVSSVTTVGTHKFIQFVFHPLLPPVFLISYPPQGILAYTSESLSLYSLKNISCPFSHFANIRKASLAAPSVCEAIFS